MANSAASSSSVDSSINISGGEGGLDDQQQNNDEIRILMYDIEKEVENVSSLESIYDIYRVPWPLHKLKPEAYTPQSVSIGPLHYKDKHLRSMHTHKLRYLDHLLNRPWGKTLDVYIETVSNLEEEARKCYSETIMELGKDEFVKMMVIDGCFILELVEIIILGEKDHFRSNDPWCSEINIDLIKLENQLPFIVLDHLHGLIFDGYELTPLYNTLTSSHHIYASLLDRYANGLHGLTLHNAEDIKSLPIPEDGPKHFLHLLQCALVPSSPTTRRKHGEKYLLSFNSPWSSISVGAAALLLLLTIIQTIFSILLFFYST